ncbi:MAG: hypothetical protein ACKOXQ_05620 [Hydrogenophaga sp.]
MTQPFPNVCALLRSFVILSALLTGSWSVAAISSIGSATYESGDGHARVSFASSEPLRYTLTRVNDAPLLLLTLAGQQAAAVIFQLRQQIAADPRKERVIQRLRVTEISDRVLQLTFELKPGVPSPLAEVRPVTDGTSHLLVLDIHTDPQGSSSTEQLAATATSAPAPVAPPASPVTRLLRDMMLAAQAGNVSGDYKALHALMSPAVKAQVKPGQLAQALQTFRERKIDLAQAVLSDPVYSRAPQHEQQGSVSVAGYFPSKPLAVRFSMTVRQLTEGWRIEALQLDALAMPDTGTASTLELNDATRKPIPVKHPIPSGKAFDSPHLDWSTDPPTAAKW